MLDGYQDLIDELLHTPATVRDCIAAGASPELLALVAALRDRDRLVIERLQQMTRQQDPHLKPLPEAAHAGAGESAEEILASFDTNRGDLVSLLMNLTLKDWERTATTDAEGVVSLADEVERHVEFDEAMIERIQQA